MTGDPLLSVEGLSVHYDGGHSLVRRRPPVVAVDGIDFSIAPGEAFALVGESGAGKSSAARCVVGLERATTGTITFDGASLGFKRGREKRRAIQMVFQDPYASLNPRMKIGSVLVELLQLNGIAPSRSAARIRAAELMEMVGMPVTALDQRPRAFSGGQRQRLGIARALAVDPTLLVADEPVSALDVSIQASILLLLKRLQQELGLTLLLISHDLAVVRQFCDRVAVMKDGRIIDSGSVTQVLTDPRQDFTRELLAATTDLPPLDLPSGGHRSDQ